MDKIPSGAGVPPGADGAFERFLTAAIATIITIMFSWRLLAEEEEAASKGEGAPPPFRASLPYQSRPDPKSYHSNSPNSGSSSANVSNLSDIDTDESEDNTNISRSTNIDCIERESVISEYSEPIHDSRLEGIPTPTADGNSSLNSEADDSLTDETLTTWDEYKWEEELGEEKRDVIHTRRSVRDFVKSANTSWNLKSVANRSVSEDTSSENGSLAPDINAPHASNTSPSQEAQLSPTASAGYSSIPFTQRFANFEYKDMGGDSGYIDLYPDVESDDSDSSDEEHEYEIQVSDSDSDSEDERGGGSFYGVTALDTILEEYESDISDVCDKGAKRDTGDAREQCGDTRDNTLDSAVEEDIVCDKYGNLNQCNSDTLRDIAYSDSRDLNRCDTGGGGTDKAMFLEILEPDVSRLGTCEKLQTSVNSDTMCIHDQNVTLTTRSDGEQVECNLPPDITAKADDNIVSYNIGHPGVSKLEKECDSTVNNTTSFNSGMPHKHEIEKYGVTENNVSISHSALNTDTRGGNKTDNPHVSSVQNAHKVSELRLTRNEETISELSDDSLPPSPVRTCALDNLGDEPFSDTESCSSSSVITVLSIRSNDSENYTRERYDVTQQSRAKPLFVNNKNAPSDDIQSSLVNDKQSTYEHTSLVSGFLNDSLNSLLSTNTGSNDTESESDLDTAQEKSEFDINDLKNNDLINANTEKRIEILNESQSVDLHMNGEFTSEGSSAESLPLIVSDLQQPGLINDTDDHNQTVNGHVEVMYEDGFINSSSLSEQIDVTEHENDDQDRFDGSDNSSDSSDPPLREYDPDDDDLAAFQFNIDSDDEDSFFLLIGDEGGLRNFETFTNLNSVGLSPEYNDAVTSRTVSDDGRGFIFSITEEENTQFSKRTYFTDRLNISDSDTRSDEPLSPILSEDEGNKAVEHEITETPVQIETPVQCIPEPKVERKSKYEDADLSTVIPSIGANECTTSNENIGIDFQKYIIQAERTSSQSLLSQDESKSQMAHKDLPSIDEEKNLNYSRSRSEIDTSAVKSSSPPVKHVNNVAVIDGHNDTLTSLTQNIRNLSLNDDDIGEGVPQMDYSNLDINTTENAELDEIVVDIESENSVQSAINVGFVNTYSDTNDLESEHIDDTCVNSTNSRTETNIDDIFHDRNVSKSRETNIDDIVPEPTQRQGENDTNKTNNTSETCIDDKSVRTYDVNEKTTKTKQRPQAKIETDIDDIFEDAKEYMNNSSPTNLKIETNIDDICTSSETTAQGKSIKIETNVDDIFDLSASNKEKSTTQRKKVETNIDDVFESDNDILVKASPVSSTPRKFENRNKLKTETNVDDIIDNNDSTYESVNDGFKTDTKSIETFVDDLFRDIIAQETSDSPRETVPTEIENKLELDTTSEKSLSYATFVDDLFDNIVPLNAGQPHTVQNIFTSEGVSGPTSHTSRPDLDFYNNSIHTADHPRDTSEDDKESVLGVKAENSSLPRTSDAEQNYNTTSHIVHGKPLTTIVDPEHGVNVESTAISHGDYNIGLDAVTDNNSNTPITVDTDWEYSIRSAHNPELIQSQGHISDYHNRPHSGTDTTKTSDTCDKNNRGSTDNISDIRDKITTEQVIKNTANQGTIPSDNEVESKEPITVHVKKSDHYSELLQTQIEDNFNGYNSGFKDHNANVSLPKGGILNNVINNNSEFGLHPDIDNVCNYTHVGSSLEASPASDTSLNNTADIQQLKYGVTSGDIEVKSVEENENEKIKLDDQSDQLDSYSSIGSCSLASDEDESLSSIEDSYHSLQDNYNAVRLRGLSESAAGRVIRIPATKPSDFFGKPRDIQGVKKRIRKHNLKKYTSILQQPVTPENVHYTVTTPELPKSVARLKVLKSRQRFLSAENLSESGGNFEDKFLQHRTSLVTSTPRKYLKRHERHLAELQSTESLPADMSGMSIMNTSYDGYSSLDRMHSLPTPRNIEELYGSRLSSANTSYERADYDKLHANCMFSPQKREEIRHTTKSLENMFEQLLRYGSISSLAETDLDADVTSHTQSFHDHYVSFQYPLERAASMSALIGSSDSHRLPRKPGGGRFASRNVPKSKSLQTLETNLDDVFADENEFSGELKKAPSVHELRVTKSLSKLTIPDWFKKSSFSRSGSTQSLFTYAGRQGSSSTIGSCAYPASITSSPSPSATHHSNAVIIQRRVTPSPTISSAARLIRAPMLPTTPEKAPIHNIPSTLPSDKYRKNEKKKDLKPIPIIPFAKLREMFEKKSNVKSPTKETPSKVRLNTATSPTREYNPVTSTSKDTVLESHMHHKYEPVQNRTASPPPPLPERKPILAESVRNSENMPQQNTQPRRTQVHFSDEQQNVSSRSQEQNSNTVRQNGAAPQTKNSTVKKPSSLRTSLPMPQFRFRRPGLFATKAAPPVDQNSSTQSKKGKDYGCHGNGNIPVDNDFVVNTTSWVHALELKAKTDGETLFEFLQKRRYSSLLENGFAEQLQELQDRDVTFNFPVLSLGKHSNTGDFAPMDGSPELQVILTNAYADTAQNGYLNNKLRGDASLDDILDGLLIMDGHSTGRMRIDDNGRIVPKMSEEDLYSPDTPPGLSLIFNTHAHNDTYNGNVYQDDNENEIETEYVLVKCQYSDCKHETNLKEAKKMYKTCHSCYTYYCSRACRKHHWETHKKACIYSRINSACKHVIKYINRHVHLQYQCSRIARRGYLAQGRGCVMFSFPDISSAEDFLRYGMESLWVPPMYVCLKELPNATMLSTKLNILMETCKQYNPELKYVIHIAIVIPPKLPVKPMPRKMETIIQKCAKLRLSPAHMHPKQDNSEIPSTFILTAVPGNQHAEEVDGRKTRELCFINIQRKLRQRGVSLRHQFADVYNKLIDFVSDAKHFSPLIIYPVDGRTGKKFMCVIMPEAEPEIEWIRDPDLFHELDVFDDEEADDTTPNLSLSLHEVHEIML